MRRRTRDARKLDSVRIGPFVFAGRRRRKPKADSSMLDPTKKLA
jgi:hypothetical protein